MDVGCGQGAWLRAFQEQGVKSIRGFDGDYVDRSGLLIDSDSFSAVDLTSQLKIESKCDLAVCLEVAEHIPAKHARRLVETLTTAAPVVLFSAAIPGQGGTEHVNTQLPAYWRRLFSEFGFTMFDPIRPQILGNRSVASWFRQNILPFASAAAAAQHPELKDFAAPEGAELEWILGDVAMSLRFLLRLLPFAAWRSVKLHTQLRSRQVFELILKMGSGHRRQHLSQASK